MAGTASARRRAPASSGTVSRRPATTGATSSTGRRRRSRRRRRRANVERHRVEIDGREQREVDGWDVDRGAGVHGGQVDGEVGVDPGPAASAPARGEAGPAPMRRHGRRRGATAGGAVAAGRRRRRSPAAASPVGWRSSDAPTARTAVGVRRRRRVGAGGRRAGDGDDGGRSPTARRRSPGRRRRLAAADAAAGTPHRGGAMTVSTARLVATVSASRPEHPARRPGDDADDPRTRCGGRRGQRQQGHAAQPLVDQLEVVTRLGAGRAGVEVLGDRRAVGWRRSCPGRTRPATARAATHSTGRPASGAPAEVGVRSSARSAPDGPSRHELGDGLGRGPGAAGDLVVGPDRRPRRCQRTVRIRDGRAAKACVEHRCSSDRAKSSGSRSAGRHRDSSRDVWRSRTRASPRPVALPAHRRAGRRGRTPTSGPRPVADAPRTSPRRPRPRCRRPRPARSTSERARRRAAPTWRW